MRGFWLLLWLWKGIDSTPQPLLRSGIVIYELDVSDFILSVLAGGLNQCGHVLVSWFLVTLSAPLQGSPSTGTHEDDAILETFFLLLVRLSWKAFCYPGGFVCAAGELSRITSTHHIPKIQEWVGPIFLGFESPQAASWKSKESVEVVCFFVRVKVLSVSPPNNLFLLQLLLKMVIKLVFPVNASALVPPSSKTCWN